MAVWFLILPLVFLFWFIRINARQGFRRNAGFGDAIRALSRLTPAREDILMLVISLIAIACIVFAIMRPQAYVESLIPEYERQDLVLVLDRSVSMYARDVLPSRYDRAIDEIKAFLVDKPEQIDRIGLVGFAGTPVTLSYLTRDTDTLFFFLEWLKEDPQIYYGTNITEALAAALELVDAENELSNRKLFLLISDGDDQSKELDALLNDLRQKNIKVHSIGVGSENSVPIPLSRRGDEVQYLEDDEGNRLNTWLDESTLRHVASSTNGMFMRSKTGRELANVLKKLVEQERQLTGSHKVQDYEDIYLLLLLLSCIATFFLIMRI